MWLPNPTEGQLTLCPGERPLPWRALLTWPGPRTPCTPPGEVALHPPGVSPPSSSDMHVWFLMRPGHPHSPRCDQCW